MKQVNIENPPFVQAKHFTKGRIKPVQLIVVHAMESPEGARTAENVADYFRRGPVTASAHYCIDADSLVQCVYDGDTAYHCKNANSNGIGLEHAGFANQTRDEWMDEYGVKMLELSAQIAAYLCEKFKILPLRAVFRSKNDSTVLRPGFCGHFDVPGHGTHHDPYREIRSPDGKRVIGYDRDSFPWEHYLARVDHYLRERTK